MRKPKKPLTKLQIFTLARNFAGVSIEDIGKALDCSPSLIYRVIKNPNKSRAKAKAIDAFIANYCPPQLRRAA